MKKLMLVVSVLFFAANVFAGQIVPKLGYEMMQTGTLKSDSSNMDTELESAMSVGVEYLSAMDDKLAFGLGIEYQAMSKYSKIDKNDVASWDIQQAYMPIYGTVQYCFKNTESFAPFAKLNLGYNMYSINSKLKDIAGDPEAGIYYAVGIGAVISKNINVTLLYNFFTANLKQSGGDTKVASNSVGLSVGYVFDISSAK